MIGLMPKGQEYKFCPLALAKLHEKNIYYFKYNRCNNRCLCNLFLYTSPIHQFKI